MALPDWREEAIARKHDRKGFDCGERALNDFLHLNARQSHERGGAKTFVAVDAGDGKTVHGYYSLSPASIEYARVPEIVSAWFGALRCRRLPAEPSGGKRRDPRPGHGRSASPAAGRRCLRVAEEAGGTVMLIDAKNERVAGWYASYGAVSLLDAPLILVLPLRTIAAALKSAGKE